MYSVVHIYVYMHMYIVLLRVHTANLSIFNNGILFKIKHYLMTAHLNCH